MKVKIIAKSPGIGAFGGQPLAIELPAEKGFTPIADVELWDGEKLIETRTIYVGTHLKNWRISLTPPTFKS
jgi:hypothetical protein